LRTQGRARCAARRGHHFADIAAHQQQIRDLLNVLCAVQMLGNAHSVNNDHSIGAHVDGCHALDLVTRDA